MDKQCVMNREMVMRGDYNIVSIVMFDLWTMALLIDARTIYTCTVKKSRTF
jgi:hypothetical protein